MRVRPTSSKQEVTRLGAALRALGSLGGGALGGVIGMPSGGAMAGNSLGAALSKWLGSGDYSVANNSLVRQSMKASGSIPMMHDSGQSVVIRHREFLGEVRGNTSFLVRDSFELNPGNRRTFPWLSSIAASFQEYRFKGVVFHYVPTSGNAISGTSAPLGSVMMQTSYRATDTPPASKVEILNEYSSNECVPSETFAHPIECDPKENPFAIQYVRTGSVPAGDSTMLYDLGVTHLAVSGQLSESVVGDLWVTYEVELKKPLLSSNVTSQGAAFYGQWTGTMTSSNVFNGALITSGNFDVTATGTTITMPKGSVGTWLAVLRVIGNPSFSVTTGTLPTLVNAVPDYWNPPGLSAATSSNVGAGSSLGSYLMVLGFRVTDPAVNPSVTFNFTLTGASVTSQVALVRITADP